MRRRLPEIRACDVLRQSHNVFSAPKSAGKSWRPRIGNSVVEPLYTLSNQRGDGLTAGLSAYALRGDRCVGIGAPFVPIGLISRNGEVAKAVEEAPFPSQVFGVTVHIGHVETAVMEQGAVTVAADI